MNFKSRHLLAASMYAFAMLHGLLDFISIPVPQKIQESQGPKSKSRASRDSSETWI